MTTLKQLYHDEVGVVVSVEVLLIVLIAGMGLIAGLTFLRDGFTQELADTGLAVNNLNQGYTVTGTSIVGIGSTNGSTFVDNTDANDGADPVGSPPPGLTLEGTSSGE